MSVANTVAYYDMKTTAAVERIIGHAPGYCMEPKPGSDKRIGDNSIFHLGLML
jgi:hypothetical protein